MTIFAFSLAALLLLLSLSDQAQRSAVYSETFWGLHGDSLVDNGDPTLGERTYIYMQQETSDITPTNETWSTDLATDTTKHTQLIQADFNSDRAPSSIGFDKAFVYYRDTAIQWQNNVTRVSDTVLKIDAPTLSRYDIPPDRSQRPTATHICSRGQFGNGFNIDVDLTAPKRHPRVAEAAYVPGYLPPTTYCTKLQNSDQFHALIELVHAQWAADGVVDEVKRQVAREPRQDALSAAIPLWFILAVPTCGIFVLGQVGVLASSNIQHHKALPKAPRLTPTGGSMVLLFFILLVVPAICLDASPSSFNKGIVSPLSSSAEHHRAGCACTATSICPRDATRAGQQAHDAAVLCGKPQPSHGQNRSSGATKPPPGPDIAHQSVHWRCAIICLTSSAEAPHALWQSTRRPTCIAYSREDDHLVCTQQSPELPCDCQWHYS